VQTSHSGKSLSLETTTHTFIYIYVGVCVSGHLCVCMPRVVGSKGRQGGFFIDFLKRQKVLCLLATKLIHATTTHNNNNYNWRQLHNNKQRTTITITTPILWVVQWFRGCLSKIYSKAINSRRFYELSSECRRIEKQHQHCQNSYVWGKFPYTGKK